MRLSTQLCTITLLAGTSLVSADSLEITRSAPTLDRWMYPFNGTVGTRPAASTFGNRDQADGAFDNRDAQMVIGFNTEIDLPPAMAEDYRVTAATVTIQVSNEGIQFDGTVDPYEVFISEDDENWIEDEDAGQPIELYGLGYRSGFDSSTWLEDTPFAVDGSATQPGTRTAFAVAYRDGNQVDISNHVREGWTPQPFAVASIDGVNPGEVIPVESIFRFDLNVDDPNIQEYLISSLSEGTLRFAVSSMTIVEVQGGIFPLFYCKENLAVDFGISSAATLALTLEPATSDPCEPADMNGDGFVNGTDLTILLGAWGSSDPVADLNGDGTVDGADLTLLLGCWS